MIRGSVLSSCARVVSLVTALGLVASISACDDGGGTDSEEPVRGEPGLTIFQFDADTTQGSVPLEVEFTVEFETSDPVADADVMIDFGDGTSTVESTGTSLTPAATDEELVTPERRSVSATHTFEEPGEYTVEAYVLDITNSDAEAGEEIRSESRTILVTVEELPDLLPTAISSDKAEIELDEEFILDVSVLNDGSSLDRSFFVELYLVNNQEFDEDSLADPTAFHRLTSFPTPGEGLQEGATLTQDARIRLCDSRTDPDACEELRTKLGDGNTWYPAVWVDPTNELQPQLNIEEDDEDNNFRVADSGMVIAPVRNEPDLVPTEIIANPATTDVLTEITLSFTIENNGDIDAPASSYSVWLSDDETLDGTDTQLAVGDLPPVLAGDNQIIANLAFPLDEPIVDPGEFWIIVEADNEGAVAEANETNNIGVATRSITVTGAQESNIDLTVENLVATPTRTFVGGQVRVTFDVTNLGDGDPGTYQCGVYLSEDNSFQANNDALMLFVGGEVLPPGTSEEYERVLLLSQFIDPGSYYVFVSCDPNDEIVESNESNNLGGPSDEIVVNAEAQVDYVPQNMTVNMMQVNENDTLEVQAEICNEGVDTATQVEVGAYLSADGTVDATDALIDTVVTQTADLAPGNCETVTISGKVACLPFVDTYTVGVIVDPADDIIETDETNNLASGTQDGLTIVGGQGSFCTCVEDGEEGGGNNTQADATAITLTGTNPQTASIMDLALCDGADFYSVTVDRGDTITAQITFDNSKGDLDLRLYDPTDMNSPFLSDGTSGTESLTEEILGTAATEEVIIEVFPKSGGERNYYTLDVTVDSPPSDPDLQVAAINLVSGQFPPVADPVVWDVEVFNDGLDDASSVEVTSWISDNTILDGGDIEVGTQSIATVASKTTETIQFQHQFDSMAESGDYYVIVQVDPNDTITETVETNNQSISSQFTLDADCFPDAFEGANGNDTFSDAWPLNPGTGFTRWDSLSVCNNGRDDYYLVCVPAGEQLNHIGAIVPSATFATGMEMTLYQLDETTTIGSDSTSSDAVISVDVPQQSCSSDADCFGTETCNASNVCADASGNHCVYARYGLRSTATAISRPYEIIVDRVEPNLAGEPQNNLQSTAVSFTSAVHVLAADPANSINVPSDDNDWYQLQVPAGTTFTVNFVAGDDDVRMVLYRDTTADFVLPFKPKTYTVSSDTDVTMRIFKNGVTVDRPSGYQITLEGLEGVDLAPANIMTDVDNVANGDPVFVSWDLVNNRLDPVGGSVTYRYVVSDDMTLDAGDTEVLRKTASGPDGFSALSIADKVDMNVPASVFGDLHLFVDVDPDDTIMEGDEMNNWISTPITIRQLCTDDTYEGNDTIGTAQLATLPFSDSGLSICSGDVDFFEVTVSDGATLSVTIDNMNTSTGTDLDLFLVDGTGSELARSDGLNTASESLMWDNTTGGAATVYVKIEAFRTDYTNVYDISISEM